MTAEALVVIVEGARCALPMERVREVRVFEGATRIPGAPQWVCGIVEREGAPVEVFDAARRLRRAGARAAVPPPPRRPETVGDRACVVFFDRAAMLVDEVDRLVPLDAIEAECTLIDIDAFFGEDA